MGIQARNPNEDDQERDEDSSGDPLEPAYDGGVGAPLLTEVDHVAVVVVDLAEAIAEQRERFGVLVSDREELFDEAAEVAFLEVGGSSIMLVAPTADDSEYAEFLAEGGPGLHHVGYRVADIEAALAALGATGAELLDEAPVTGPRGSRVAYVHPDSAHGVLVQLVQR